MIALLGTQVIEYLVIDMWTFEKKVLGEVWQPCLNLHKIIFHLYTDITTLFQNVTGTQFCLVIPPDLYAPINTHNF